MSLTRTLAVMRKELRHIYRDRQIMFMTILAPAFVLFLLGNVFSFDLQGVRIGVMDQDRSATSRKYVQALTADGDVQVVGYLSGYAAVEELLIAGKAGAAIVIPPGFGESVASGVPKALQLVLDGSDYQQSEGISRDLSQRTMAFGATLLRSASLVSAPVTVRSRALYNPTLKWLYTMVPGLMAAAFCFPAIAVAVACTREVEQGSYEGLLSTPLRIPEYLLGKLVPYLAVGSLGAILSWGLALAWFKVPFRGSLLNFLFLAVVFLLSLMSFSILVGSMARNQRHVIIIIVLAYFIPTFFMSGLLSPLEPGTLTTRILRLVLPAASYVRINRALFLKGLRVSELVPEMVSLLRVSVLSLAASFVLARRKVA